MRHSLGFMLAAILVLCLAAQLCRGQIEALVLNTIDRSNSYGYEVVVQIRQVYGLEASENDVCPALEKLSRMGYIEARKEKKPADLMHRYYSLTTAGRKRVAELNSFATTPFPGDFVLDWQVPPFLKALSSDRVCSRPVRSRRAAETR